MQLQMLITILQFAQLTLQNKTIISLSYNTNAYTTYNIILLLMLLTFVLNHSSKTLITDFATETDYIC